MLKNYLKVAFKVLLRRKFFTFISLFATSFTLVVLMIVTAFLDHTFGPLAPETRLDRTLGIYYAEMSGPQNVTNGQPGYLFLDRYARDLPGVERASFFTAPRPVTTYRQGEKHSLYLKRTDGEFWQILDFNFLEGGPFTAADERDGNYVAVINEATKNKLLGGGAAVGKSIELDGRSYRVVGVVRNVPIFRVTPFSDIWIPISATKSQNYRKDLVGNFMGILLARSRADFPSIKEELQSRTASVEISDPRAFNKFSSAAETLFEFLSRQLFGGGGGDAHAGRLLAAIVVLMVLFMLLPTLNLVNLNVSRIMERASEIGVRKAFGASSLSLVGQFVVENLVLTLVGGIAGLVGSLLVLRALTASGFVQYAEFHLNYRIFLYGLAITVFFGLLSGVYPAWRMSRLHPVEALRGGGGTR